jgi:DNA-binding GntR family transcriptional regulator
VRRPLNTPARRTAADDAEIALFQGIRDGAIPPGSPLRLQELADELDMSHMPIREALRRLQNLGLVELVPHKGAWVRPLTLEDLYDSYFTRIHLEALAVWTAARRLSGNRIELAHTALAEKAQADDRGDLLASRDAHERFHFALYDASGSDWLIRSIWPAWRNCERYRVVSMRDPEHAGERAAEHGATLRALEAGDSDQAVRLLVRHLRSSVDRLAAALNTAGTPAPIELPNVEDLLLAASS